MKGLLPFHRRAQGLSQLFTGRPNEKDHRPLVPFLRVLTNTGPASDPGVGQGGGRWPSESFQTLAAFSRHGGVLLYFLHSGRKQH
jgi:hypothetical protein